MKHDRAELLEHLHRDDFLQTVERAKRQTAEAIQSRDTLVAWAERIGPYLEADAHITIAQAIDRYKREHGVPHDERST